MTIADLAWASAPSALIPDTSSGVSGDSTDYPTLATRDDVSGVSDDSWDDATDVGVTRTGAISTDEPWTYDAPQVADHPTLVAASAPTVATPRSGEAPKQKPKKRRKLKAPGPAKVHLTKNDLKIVSFLLRFKFATAEQLARFTGRSASSLRRRLPELESVGVLKGRRAFHLRSKLWSVTPRGRDVTGSDLPTTRFAISHARHTLAIVDLAIGFLLAGHDVVSDKELRVALNRGENLAATTVEAPVEGGTIGDQLARKAKPIKGDICPDLLIRTSQGDVAIEVEASEKSTQSIIEAKLKTYVASGRYVAVQYYCTTDSIARAVGRAIQAVPGAPALVTAARWNPIELAGTPYDG